VPHIIRDTSLKTFKPLRSKTADGKKKTIFIKRQHEFQF
jgi:hypothetical protein